MFGCLEQKLLSIFFMFTYTCRISVTKKLVFLLLKMKKWGKLFDKQRIISNQSSYSPIKNFPILKEATLRRENPFANLLIYAV